MHHMLACMPLYIVTYLTLTVDRKVYTHTAEDLYSTTAAECRMDGTRIMSVFG